MRGENKEGGCMGGRGTEREEEDGRGCLRGRGTEREGEEGRGCMGGGELIGREKKEGGCIVVRGRKGMHRRKGSEREEGWQEIDKPERKNWSEWE